MSQQTEQAATTVPFAYDEQLIISVNVSDLARALDWYRDVLGFEIVYRMDDIGWAEIRTPWNGITIGLSQTEEQRAGGTVPTFGVKSMEEAKRHFERHAVKMDETFDVQGMVLLTGFYDPDGNPWMLAESHMDRDGAA